MRWWWLAVLAGCGSPRSPAPGGDVASGSAIANAVPAVVPLHCPPPTSPLDDPNGPPWERDPLGLLPKCIELSDGGRATMVPDPTDTDGWRHTLVVADRGGVRFELATRAAMAMAATADGGVVLVHTENFATRITARGSVAWKADFPKCGFPSGIAIDPAGDVTFGCGYSLVRLSAAGVLLWQKWPFGNTHISRPLRAKDGTIYASGRGVLAALDDNGDIRWQVDTGGNRHVHPLGVLATGELVFRTSMAAMHSDGPVRRYYRSEPPELFVVARDGRVVSRTTLDTGAVKWPAALPWSPEFRSGRIP